MTERLRLSVIVPVQDSAATLEVTLRAILSSDLSRCDYELIVIDDASNDRSAAIAARYADTVIRLAGKPAGPAYARNRGLEIACGDAVAFIEPDTLISHETLSSMLDVLRGSPMLDAVVAAHDDVVPHANFFSQYWNLLLHYGDKAHAGVGGNFSCDCGMVRRATLRTTGLFDEWRFPRGGLESVEFGQRLQMNGRNVLLCDAIRVTKTRGWTIWSVTMEVWRRTTTITRSLGYQRTRDSAPAEVALTLCRAGVPALAFICAVFMSASFLPRPAWLLKGAFLLAGVFVTNFQVTRFFARRRGIPFAIAVTPVHLVLQGVGTLGLCAGWIIRDAIGDHLPDAATQAYAEVGVETWPPVPRPPTALE